MTRLDVSGRTTDMGLNFRSIVFPAFLSNSNGQIVGSNNAFCEMSGYSEHELQGTPINNICPSFEGKSKPGAVANYETRLLRRDLDPVEVEVSYFGTVSKNLVLSIWVVRDITDQKKLVSELQLRAKLLDGATDSIFLHDLRGNIKYVNEMAYASRGYPKSELMSMNLRDIVASEFQPVLRSRVAILRKEGKSNYESAHICKSGSIMPVDVHARIVDEDLILSVCRDVTEKKRVESELKRHQDHLQELVDERTAALRKSNDELTKEIAERKKTEEALTESQKFSTVVIENAPNPILVADPDMAVRYVNPALLAMVGFEREELVGKGPPYPWSTEKHPRSRKKAFGLAANGKADLEQVIRNKNGETIWVRFSTTGVTDETGKLRYYLSNIVDITEQKKTHETLKCQAAAEKLVSSISRTFVGLNSDEAVGMANNALKRFCKFSGADHCYVLEENHNPGKLNSKYEWHASGTHESQNDYRTIVDDFSALLKASSDRSEVFTSTDLKPESQSTQGKEKLSKHGLGSFVAIRSELAAGKKAFFLFGSESESKTWTEETINLARIVCEILSNALRSRRSGKTRVVVAGDEALLRQGISNSLASDSLDLVGSAETEQATLKLVSKHKPDAIVLSFDESATDICSLRDKIKDLTPEATVLAVIASQDLKSRFTSPKDALREGYLPSNISPDGLVDALLRTRTMALDAGPARKKQNNRPKGLTPNPLNPRELEIIQLASQGMSSREIAKKLSISERTVESHLHLLFLKIGVNSRSEAIYKALKNHWIVLR